MQRYIFNRKHKIISFLLACLLTYPVYAQDLVAKDQQWIISDFSGGLATKPSSLNLPQKYATICENIRLETEHKSLTKRDRLLLYGVADTSEPITGIYRLYLSNGTKVLLCTHGDELEKGADATGVFTPILDLSTGDYRWQFVTWHDLAIGGDGYNQPIKTDGTDATYLGTCFAEDNGAGAGPNGDYTYKISFYTASYEVLFAVVSNLVTVVDNDIDLKMIPIGPDTYGGEDIVGRKVYRSDAGAVANWELLTNGTIADNTTTILTDSDADGAKGVAYPAGDATWTPPKCRFWLINNNRLFGANDVTNGKSRIYYSEDGSHDLFIHSTSYFEIRKNDGNEITGIFNLLGLLTIAKTNTWQRLYTDGDDPSVDWAISDPFSFIGCHAPYGAKNTPLGIIYPNRGGLYKFNGQHSMLISDIISPIINDISLSNFANSWGEFHENIYHLAYTSKAVGGSVNNRVLRYDLLTDAYTIDLLSMNAFCTFNSGSDWGVLYGGGSEDGKVYSYALASQEVVHKRHSDFIGTWDDARYIPVMVGGDPDDPVIELAWAEAIDDVAGTVNACGGDIDRPDTDGTYISQVLNTIGVSSYDKLYWNEYFPSGATTNATFSIRSKATSPPDGAWTNEYTDPGGSDISGETANTYTQYRISLSTSDIDYTPNVIKRSFVVRMSYDLAGTAAELSIPLHWRGGWTNLKYPGYDKVLKKVEVFLKGTTGTLTLQFENWEGDTDTFEIDIDTYPTHYEEYFTNGAFRGRTFRLDITETSLSDIKIRKVICHFDVEPFL